MSHISIERDHDLDQKTLRKRAEKLAKALQSKYGGSYSWEDNTVHYSYSGGIDAYLTLNEEDVQVDVELGMLMSMAKKRIKSEIERHMEEHLS